jgi:glycosyltransferase involved in cell wall biosynthesis
MTRPTPASGAYELHDGTGVPTAEDSRPSLLVVIDKMTVYGGERVAQQMIDHLAADFRVLLVTFNTDASNVTWVPPDGVRWIRVRPRGGKILSFFGVVRAINRLVRRERPDVSLSFMGMANAILGFATLGTACPVVMSEHNVISRARSVTGVWRPGFAILRRLAYRRATGIVCVSADVAQDLKKHKLVGPAAAVVIHNPVDIARLRSESQLATDAVEWRASHPGQKLIVLVGALRAAKGHLLALNTLELLNEDCEMVFVGDGPMRGRIEEHIQRSGLEARTTLTGTLPNPYSWMCEADVVIAPSAYEGFGLVAAEARALLARVIVTDVPGLREIAPLLGVTLVPGDDAPALAAAIADRLQQPRPTRCSWLESVAPIRVAQRYAEVLRGAIHATSTMPSVGLASLANQR